MRISLITIVFTLLVYVISAQQIPNGGFEGWTSGEPDSWDTSNENILGTQFTTVSQISNDVHSGSYSVKVTTVTENVFLVGALTLPGILTLGEFVIDVANQRGTVEGGIPFPHRPVSLSGYYKAEPVSGDYPVIAVGLSVWNTTTNERDTIGSAEMSFTQSTTSWTKFEMIIDWKSPDDPDSLNIIISSSDIINSTSFTAGSTISVDSLSFTYPSVNISTNEAESAVKVYPNPSDQLVYIEADNIESIDIIDINGRRVLSRYFGNEKIVEIDLSGISHGIYTIVINNGKDVVSHHLLLR